jgi:hypothetical protein
LGAPGPVDELLEERSELGAVVGGEETVHGVPAVGVDRHVEVFLSGRFVVRGVAVDGVGGAFLPMSGDHAEHVGIDGACGPEENGFIASGQFRVLPGAVGDAMRMVEGDLARCRRLGDGRDLAERRADPCPSGELAATFAGAVRDPRRRRQGAVVGPVASLLEVGEERARPGECDVDEPGDGDARIAQFIGARRRVEARYRSNALLDIVY